MQNLLAPPARRPMLHVTSLANGVALLRRLSELGAGSSSAQGSAVVYVDLDRFKSVSDTLGPGSAPASGRAEGVFGRLSAPVQD